MKRAAGMTRIEKDALAVGNTTRQVLGQIFVGDRRRGDNDQIGAVYDRRQMRTHKIGRREFLRSILYQLDPAAFNNRDQRRFRTGKKPDLVAAQRQIRGGGATTVTGS